MIFSETRKCTKKSKNKTQVAHKKAKMQLMAFKSIFATFQKTLAPFCLFNPEGSNVHWKNINCINQKCRETENA